MLTKLWEKVSAKQSEIKRFCIVSASITAAAAIIDGGNYLTHNQVTEDSPTSFTLYKKDGLLSYSSVVFSYKQNDVILYRTDPFGRGSRRYSDNNRDGILDAVEIDTPWFSIGGIQGTFNTQNNASTHAQLLETENKLYQQELREFAQQYQQRYPEKFKQLGLEKILTR